MTDKKKVKFRTYYDCHYIKPFKSLQKINKQRKRLQNRARKLARIERTARNCDLLFKGEYLEFTNDFSKNIRIPFIKQISVDLRFCSKSQNLKIIR
jgi:hypothetical protein